MTLSNYVSLLVTKLFTANESIKVSEMIDGIQSSREIWAVWKKWFGSKLEVASRAHFSSHNLRYLHSNKSSTQLKLAQNI